MTQIAWKVVSITKTVNTTYNNHFNHQRDVIAIMVVVDALMPNKHQAVVIHHAVNTDSSQDFIWNLYMKDDIGYNDSTLGLN